MSEWPVKVYIYRAVYTFDMMVCEGPLYRDYFWFSETIIFLQDKWFIRLFFIDNLSVRKLWYLFLTISVMVFTGKALIYEGYLEEEAVQGGFGATVHLSSKGDMWMRDPSKNSLKIVPMTDMVAADNRPRVTVQIL